MQKLQITTIQFNGISIESYGNGELLIHTNAPAVVKVDDLLAEINSLFQTQDVSTSHSHSWQSPCKRPSELPHKVGLG